MNFWHIMGLYCCFKENLFSHNHYAVRVLVNLRVSKSSPYIVSTFLTANDDTSVIVLLYVTENRLTYSIVEGNENGAFEVASDVGEIKVRGELDYEEVRGNSTMPTDSSLSS